jgi:molecular chaperone Hsp33
MADRIIRGLAGDNQVRFLGVDCLQTAREAQGIHQLSITTTALMSRLLAAGLMMGIERKSKREIVTLKINSLGAVRSVIVTSNNQGEIKCYVDNPQAELPLKEGKIDVGGLLGEGSLTVIRDLQEKQPYSGTVELVDGEIAVDLSYYYTQSEQIPAGIGLGALIEPGGEIRQAGGFIVQLMPDAEDRVIGKLEQNLEELPNLTDLLDMGYTIESILQEMILKGLKPQILQTVPGRYYCDCSREKFIGGLQLLETEELEEYLEKNEEVVVVCHFCNTEYRYGSSEIEKVLNDET